MAINNSTKRNTISIKLVDIDRPWINLAGYPFANSLNGTLLTRATHMAYINTGAAGQMSPEQAANIIRVLQQRNATRPCPRCGNQHFTLLEGFFNQPVSGDYFSGGFFAYPQGPTVPSVVTACSNCGFLSQHALGVLGLLPSDMVSPAKG